MANQAIIITILTAIPRKYNTIHCGMTMKILKNVLSLDNFSGYSIDTITG
jgi:hypothetical protein